MKTAINIFVLLLILFSVYALLTHLRENDEEKAQPVQKPHPLSGPGQG